MADVNTMTLREPDPIAAEAYVDGGQTTFKPIPPKGLYTLISKGVEWGATNEGYLQAVLTHVVQAPGQPYDGHEVRFHRVNTKKWPNREGSSILDYLRAHGVTEIPVGAGANERYRALVTALLGRPFQAGLDWEAFLSGVVEVKGMENFPNTPDGGKQDWVANPAEPGKKVYARARIVYTVSQVGK